MTGRPGFPRTAPTSFPDLDRKVCLCVSCPRSSRRAARRQVFLSPDYKEEQLRPESGPCPTIRHSDFVIRTSLGESLGWDVSNKAGLTEACPERSRRVFKPVIHEESIKACPELGRRVAGATKAPDRRDLADGRRLTANGHGSGR